MIFKKLEIFLTPQFEQKPISYALKLFGYFRIRTKTSQDTKEITYDIYLQILTKTSFLHHGSPLCVTSHSLHPFTSRFRRSD